VLYNADCRNADACDFSQKGYIRQAAAIIKRAVRNLGSIGYVKRDARMHIPTTSY